MLTFLAMFACAVILFVLLRRREEPFTDATIESQRVLNDQRLQPVTLGPTNTVMATEPIYYIGGDRAVSTSPQRECAIYNTSNVDLCTAHEKWYNLPRESLLQIQGDTTRSAADRAAAGSILAEVATGKLPNSNVCRVNFGRQGWVEPTVTKDGQVSIPLKNITDPYATAYGDTLNWGRCYKSLAGGATVSGVQQGMANNNGIIGLSDSYSPFKGDMQNYTGIKFATHTFDSLLSKRDTSSDTYAKHLTSAYCNSSKEPPPNMTNVLFAFPMDASGLIHDMYPVRLNTQTLRFDKVPDTNNSIIGALFHKKLNTLTLALELVPTLEGGQVTIVYYDLCGRIDTTDIIPIAMSMTNIAMIPKVTLAKSAYTTDVTYGEYDDLEALLASKQSTAGKTQNDISNYTNPTFKIDYKAGVICSEYTVNESSPINNAAAFDNIVRPGATNVTNTNVKPLPGFDIDKTNNQIQTSTSNAGIVWVWSGYLKAPTTGTYHFYINTDEAADITVSGHIAATYYGSHGTAGKGVVGGGVYMQADVDTYYPMTVRVYNSAGTGSVNVYWDLAGSLSTFQYIPATAYFYNDNLLKLEKSRKELKDLQGDISILQDFLETVDSTAGNAIANVAVNTRNKTFLGPNWNAKYLSGVDPRNPPDRYVYVQFNAVSAAYTPVPPVDNNGMYTIETGPFNIANATGSTTSPLPVGIDFNNTPVYTVCLGINIEKTQPAWRNIFSLGDNNTATLDRTPCLQISPGTSALFFHHASTSMSSTGINATKNALDLNKYYYVCMVVNKNTIQLYINNTLDTSFTLPSGDQFVWKYDNHVDLTNKMIRYGVGNTTAPNSYVNIRDFVWFNTALTSTQVATITTRFTY